LDRQSIIRDVIRIIYLSLDEIILAPIMLHAFEWWASRLISYIPIVNDLVNDTIWNREKRYFNLKEEHDKKN